MSEQNAELKPKYVTPQAIPLGEMAKGAGQCVSGSSNTDECFVGNAASGLGCFDGNAASGAGAHCGNGSGVI